MSDAEDSQPTGKKTTLGVPVENDLRDRLKAAAKLEGRTEAGFARFHLERAATAILEMNEEGGAEVSALTLSPLSPEDARMSSLTIAEITGKNHAHVMRDIRNVLDEAGIDQSKFGSVYKAGNGEDRSCYNLPRLECDLIVSGYSVKYRLAIIKRWHELETKQSFKVPQTFGEALRLAADLNDQLLLAAPKVEFYDRVTESGNVCQLAVAAQVAKLPFGRNILFQKLRELGVLITGGERHNLPKQEFIKRGLFTVNERKFEKPDTGEPIVSFTTYATQKGVSWIIEKFGNQSETEARA